MSKTSGNVVNPLDLVDDFGVDGFRYYVLAETPYGPDGDFTYEGLIARYNSDLANNLGNLLSPRRHRGRARSATASAPRRAPTRRWPRSPPRRCEGTAAAWAERAARAAPSTPPGSSSAPPTPTSRPTSRGRPSPAPAVDAVMGDALEALRIVADPRLARRARHRPGGLGAHRPARRRSTDQRLPDAAAWGGYPGGAPGR